MVAGHRLFKAEPHNMSMENVATLETFGVVMINGDVADVNVHKE